MVEFWESLCCETATHDVTFKSEDGTVGAHHLILARASPVLAAMLLSAMREGSSKCVDVKSTPSKAVMFFLELLYSGTSFSEVDSTIALSSLELAHQWQVDRVVALLEHALETMLTDETFERIAGAAVLKDLSELKKACLRFARSSTEIQQKSDGGELPQVVLKFLGKSAEPKSSAKKRRIF